MLRSGEFKFESLLANKYKRQQLNCFNKYYNQTVSKPYFLTRQTANLMEDFTRELNEGASLFLLYGEDGVGKTRLLEELGYTRLAERAIFWLDLESGEQGDETRMDRSTEVEALFAAAGKGDIIIADHFEAALKKTRHQLFLSWSTDGIDKQLNLIIASSIEGFNELRQLSQQYQVRVESFQQMPFSEDEVRSFLGFYLFPDNPVGKLSIPSPLRKQIAAAKGNVGRVIEIVERDGDQIQSAAPVEQTESVRQGSRVIFAALLLFVLAVGIGWYLYFEPRMTEPAPAIVFSTETDATTPAPADEPEPEAQAEVVAEPEVAVPAEGATEDGTEAQTAAVTDNTDEAATATAAETEAEPESAAISTAAVEPEPVATPAAAEQESIEVPAAAADSDTAAREADDDAAATEVAAAVQPEANTAQQSETLLAGEPGTASDSEAVIVEAPSQATVADEPAPVPADNRQRFDLELQQSLEWIGQRENSVGTIQILLLSYDGFDPDNYYAYVANLAQRGVDPERLHVFKTLTGNREVYSVMYGEFPTRKAAINAIDGLPRVLRDTSPLGRSVGGIWQEIRRLGSKN